MASGGEGQDPQGLGQDGGPGQMHRRLPGQRRHRHAGLAPDDFHGPPEDDGEPDGQKDQHQVALGPGRTDAHHLHQDGHQGHPRHRQEQGRGHGEAGGDQGAVEDHAPQGDEIHLGEVDDPHGVVHHPEAQGHQGIDGPTGQTGKDELHQVLQAAHVSFLGSGCGPESCGPGPVAQDYNVI